MIGAANEMYTAQLSSSFIGMTFPQAVEYVNCYLICDPYGAKINIKKFLDL